MPSIMQYICYVLSQACTEIKGRTGTFASEQLWPVNRLGRQGEPAENLHTGRVKPCLEGSVYMEYKTLLPKSLKNIFQEENARGKLYVNVRQ